MGQEPLITSAQVRALRKRGLDPSPDMTRARAKQIHGQANVIRRYISSLWYEHAGHGPSSKDCPVEYEELETLIYRFAADAELANQIVAIEEIRDEATHKAIESAMKGSGDDRMLAEQGEWFRFRPPLVKDAIYRRVEQTLREALPGCLPEKPTEHSPVKEVRRGWLSRLLGL